MLEHGSVVHIRLIILEELAPMNPAAYPPREDGATTPASPSSPQAATAATAAAAATRNVSKTFSFSYLTISHALNMS